MFRPAQFNMPQQAIPNIDRIQRFRGVNYSVDATQLEYNEAADILNMYLDTEGALIKRTGYAELYATSLGAGKINGMYRYLKNDGTAVNLVHHGTKLYTFLTDGTQPTEIYASMANQKSTFFTFAGKCHILDGSNYLEFDGTTVQAVVPYVPTVYVSTPPAGGGEEFEEFNLLTGEFKQAFSGDGVSTLYQLSVTGLDGAAVTASVDGGVTFDRVETTHFTVDRTLGQVTWLVAQASGTNNIYIKASKTVAGNADKIKKCTGYKLFGGTNDTRVFLWGSDRNTLYRSDVYRAHYFPVNNFQQVGSTETRITALSQQYDTAIIYKEESIWAMGYDDTGDRVRFPVRTINSAVGCRAPGSMQLIENNPVSFESKGVYILQGGNVRDERNVSHQSRRIDRLLLAETGEEAAVSIDYDKKYWLALNGKVYLWDYKQPQQDRDQIGEWTIFDNVPASCFLEIEGRLYFGSSESGMIYYFKKHGEQLAYRDIDQGIQYRWYGRITAMGMDERRKTVQKLAFAIKPDSATSASLYYVTDQVASELIVKAQMNLFDFGNINFGAFSFIVSQFPQVTMVKIKAKNIVYFQPRFEGSEIDESLGLMSVEIIWQPKNFVK